jgi:hypothetical protein
VRTSARPRAADLQRHVFSRRADDLDREVSWLLEANARIIQRRTATPSHSEHLRCSCQAKGLEHSPDDTHGSAPAVEEAKSIGTTPDNGLALRKKRTNQTSAASSFRTTPAAPDMDVDESHLGHQAGVVSQEDAEMLQGQLSSDQQSPAPATSAGHANAPISNKKDRS